LSEKKEKRKVKITPFRFAQLRNFPNSLTPPFLCRISSKGIKQFPPGVLPVGTGKCVLILTHPFSCKQTKAINKNGTKTPAPRPSQTVTLLA